MNKKYYLTQTHYFDAETNLVYCKGSICKIALLQLEFLKLLIQYNGKVCPYNIIYSTLWESSVDNNKSSSKLRALVFKLKSAIPDINVQSYSSMGYILYTKQFRVTS